jgi:hypothetical protein
MLDAKSSHLSGWLGPQPPGPQALGGSHHQALVHLHVSVTWFHYFLTAILGNWLQAEGGDVGCQELSPEWLARTTSVVALSCHGEEDGCCTCWPPTSPLAFSVGFSGLSASLCWPEPSPQASSPPGRGANSGNGQSFACSTALLADKYTASRLGWSMSARTVLARGDCVASPSFFTRCTLTYRSC